MREPPAERPDAMIKISGSLADEAINRSTAVHHRHTNPRWLPPLMMDLSFTEKSKVGDRDFQPLHNHSQTSNYSTCT